MNSFLLSIIVDNVISQPNYKKSKIESKNNEEGKNMKKCIYVRLNQFQTKPPNVRNQKITIMSNKKAFERSW